MRGPIAVLGAAFALQAACATAQDHGALLTQGKQLFTDQGCHGCHMVGAAGTPIASNLAQVGAKYSQAYLYDWLRDPAMQKPTAHMPRIELTEAQARALAAYLGSLR